MRVGLSVLLVVAAAVWSSCAPTPAEAPLDAGRDLTGPAGGQGATVTLRLPPSPPSPPTLPPIGDGARPKACGYPPPPLLTPRAGAVVSGEVVISAPLLEGPCYIVAAIVFMVADSNGNRVHRGCDNDVPAHTTWDTTRVPNGLYWITAQRACYCDPCAEYSYIPVTVANPS